MAENVAKVTLEVGTDTSKVAGQVAAAKAQVEAGGGGMAGAANRATEATKRQAAELNTVGERLKGIKKIYGEQIEVVQGLIGKLAAIGGTVFIAYRVGQAIREYIVTALSDAVEKSTTFKNNLDLTDVSGSLTQVQGQIRDLQSRLAQSLESNVGSLLNLLTGDTVESLKTQIQDLQRLERSLSQTQEAEKKRKESERAADEARRKAEEERRKEEEWHDQLRKWYEEQQRRAIEVQQSWSNAYRAIREESNRAFATDQAASMVQFAQQMRIEGMTATANMNQIIVQGVG